MLVIKNIYAINLNKFNIKLLECKGIIIKQYMD